MKNRLPPLNSLRAFEAAARLLSFKQAADELAVTPTAVSHQIKLLEGFLGLPLFRRLTRALELTPEGQAMLPKVQEGFASLVAAVEAVRHKETAGVVTLCAPPSFAARWLIPRLGNFARAHPEIELRLSSSTLTIDRREKNTSPESKTTATATLAYDLMIRFGRGDYPGHDVDCLFKPAYVTVCSPTLINGEHPLREPRDLRWHTLIRDTTVADLDDRPGWGQWLDLAGVGELEDQDRGPQFEDAALAVEAAIAGHGIALAARPLVSADIALGRLAMPFALSVPSQYAYFVTSPSVTTERPTVLAARAWLLQEAARERAAEAGVPDRQNGSGAKKRARPIANKNSAQK